MGVPSFFAWLVKKYPDLIIKDEKMECDALFLDWNGGIHPACRRILEKYKDVKKNRHELENEMIQEVLSYLYSVVEFANPKKCIYIAIDGVAPRAKMNQQRNRRFKSIKERKEINEIKRKYGQSTGVDWDTNAITPGTEFMDKIKNSIINACKEKFSQTVIFSDSSVPMEGEHKLISNLKKHGHNFSTVFIYGLDADLIFLSSMCTNCDIYLLRERDQFNISAKNAFCFLDINSMKEKLHNEMRVDFELKTVVNDFVVLCFFLGNDFIPKIPSLFIKHGGVDILLENYYNVAKETNEPIVKNDEINFCQLKKVLQPIAENEGFSFINYYKKHKHLKPMNDDTCENALLKYEMVNPCPTDDPIKLGKSGWKQRYYDHYFGGKEIIESVCKDYMKTITWIWKYYNSAVPSWEWYYPYKQSPILSDLLFYFDKVQYNEIKFPATAPVLPFAQLLSVLPQESLNLLPPDIEQHAINHPLFMYYYPKSFTEDMLYKERRWQCIPNIPFIDTDFVNQILEKCKYNKLNKHTQQAIQLN